MVNSVGPGPTPNIQFQQNNAAAQQEIRARNAQTQPRQAPAADSQTADQRSLQSKDEQRRQAAVVSQRRQDQVRSADAQDNRRGQLLDITA